MYSFKISVGGSEHSFSIVSTENDEHVTEGVTVGNNHQIGLSSSFFEHSASEQFNRLLTAIADRIPELQFEGRPTASRYLGEPTPTKIQHTFKIPSPPDCYPKILIPSLPFRSSFLRQLGAITSRIKCDKLELTNLNDPVNNELKAHIRAEYEDTIKRVYDGSMIDLEIWVLWCYRQSFKYPFVITESPISGCKSTVLNWTNTDGVLREMAIYEYAGMCDVPGIVMRINELLRDHSTIMWWMPGNRVNASAFYRRVCIIAKSLAVPPDLVEVTSIDNPVNYEVKSHLQIRFGFEPIVALETYVIRGSSLGHQQHTFVIIKGIVNGKVATDKIHHANIALTIYQYTGMVDELAIITDINKVLNS